MAYAEKTSVGTDKSRSEIERTLQKYGADQFMYGWDQYYWSSKGKIKNEYYKYYYW